MAKAKNPIPEGLRTITPQLVVKGAAQALDFYKKALGATEIVHAALTSGKINMYPEYTGVVVQVVYHHTSSPKTAAATYQLAKQLEATHGISALPPTPFFDMATGSVRRE